ncbi:hypothetical protein [Melghirimyces algeriensis]|nr:hypothetical protein [Melghirimyces algeriensis]
MKRTPSASLLEERDAETDIAPSPLCHEPQKVSWHFASIAGKCMIRL